MGAAAHFQLTVIPATGQFIQAVCLPPGNGDQGIGPGLYDIADGMEPGFFQLARRHPADAQRRETGRGARISCSFP